jgi:hypothetical protein
MVHSFMYSVHSAYTLLLISNLFSDHRIIVFISLPLCILTVCFGSVHPNHAILLPLAYFIFIMGLTCLLKGMPSRFETYKRRIGP